MPDSTQEAAPRKTEGRRRTARRETLLLAACILLLLLATVPPLINLGRYQHRIASAISRSIGRPVSMDAISLRLLPWPAFKIANLTVGEDPAFGAEPSLLAPEVVVEPRLTSLWRGRFELSRIELTDASVNLVRGADGRWNVSSVLLQASHMQNAPTGQKTPGAAPRFPYIEATGTRINLKRGAEKLPYSLLNADFSMWLARPDVWQIKLEGQPVRTDVDLSLSDTGLLHIEGELHRASALGTMPLVMTGEWNHAPLGQLSRLLMGQDGGWRGDIDATAQVKGEIDHLDVRTHLVMLNLHRQEFTPVQPFTVDATCRGHYSRSSPPDDALHCRWPVGSGALEFGGTTGGGTLAADRVPATFVAAVLGLIRPGVPVAQWITGELSGSFGYDAVSGMLSGDAAAPELRIADAGPDGTALVMQGVAMHAVPGMQPSLAITGKPIALGVTGAPLTLSAELTQQGYTLHASGSATLPLLQQAAKSLHLPAMQVLSAFGTAPSTAQLALTTSGVWFGGDAQDRAAAQAMGSVHFENVRWSPAWLPVPVRLASASASIEPGMVRWSTPAATIAANGGILRFAGEAAVPKDCLAPQECRTHISLRTDALDARMLQTALLSAQRPMLTALLDRMDAGASQISLPEVTASVHAGVLTLGRLPVRDVSAVVTTGQAETSGPVIQVESLDGHALGGTVHMRGTVSASGSGPRYRVKLLIAGVSAPEAAALWHENWGPGTLGGTAEFSLAGKDTAELLGSIKGDFRASWLHGELAPAIPRFASWDGSGTLGADGLAFTQSTLSGTPETIAGKIGWNRALELQLLGGNEQATGITGTLGAPVVSGQPPSD